MNNDSFFVWFKNDEERNFFIEDIMTEALINEIQNRNSCSRKIKFIDIHDRKFFYGLTFEMFYGTDIKDEVISTIFSSLVKNNNLMFYMNFESAGFAYLYDTENSQDTLLICGSFLDYY